jgi:hypothetical protein
MIAGSSILIDDIEQCVVVREWSVKQKYVLTFDEWLEKLYEKQTL